MVIDPERYARAGASLEGLSVGDTFGECYFIDPDHIDRLIEERVLRDAPWRYTDDTERALSILSHLRHYGRVDQDRLVESFAHRYSPDRGYGPAIMATSIGFGEESSGGCL